MKLKISLAQCNPKLGDLAKNIQMILDWTEKGRRAGAGMMVFPELALTGYFVKDLVPELALKAGDPRLGALARASRGMDLMVGGILEENSHRYYNAAFIFRDGKLAGLHRKIYLPTYGLFDEGRYLDAGSGLETYQTRAGKTSCLICEDAWHAVLPLHGALEGSGLLCIPSSSPARSVAKSKAGLGIADTWQQLNRTWALTLGLNVAYCNRVGFEDGVGFWGGSEVVDAGGKVLARGPQFKEALVTAEVDLSLVRRARLAAPVLRDENLDLNARLFSGLAGWKLAAPAQPRSGRSRA